MKVTKPMIERGHHAYLTMAPADRNDPREMVETILRRALKDEKRPPEPIPGQIDIYEALGSPR